MNTNDFYEVNGCMDFIPVTIVGKYEDGVIVTPTSDKQNCQLVVKEVYRLPKVQEPQKVTIPKFVAEWIEEARAKKYSLYGAWEMVKESSEVFWWVFNGHESNQGTFARAWLDGYEIEKEKLYTVEIPNPNSAGGKLVLFKQQSTGRLILGMLNPDINKPKYLHLTESEIKQDFDFLWQSAKEVE